MRHLVSLTVTGVLLLGAVLPAGAQQDFFQNPADGQFTVGARFIHPYFETPAPSFGNPYPPQYDTFSGVYDVYAVIPFTRHWSAVLDVPYIRFSVDGRDDVETAFGNVYVGARYNRLRENSRRTFHLGVTVPTSQKDDYRRLAWAAVVNYHEVYKYVPGGVCGYAAAGYRLRMASGLLLGYDLGGMVMVNTAYENADTEFYWRYGGSIGYDFSSFDLQAGFMGLFLMTSDSTEIDGQFWTDLMFKGTWNRGLVRPAIFYRIPLYHEVQDVLNATLGVQLEFAFGGV